MPSNCTLQQGGRHQTTIYHPEKYDSSVHSILIDGVPFPTVVQDFPGAEWAGGRESKEDLGSGTIWIDSEEDLGSGTIRKDDKRRRDPLHPHTSVSSTVYSFGYCLGLNKKKFQTN